MTVPADSSPFADSPKTKPETPLEHLVEAPELSLAAMRKLEAEVTEAPPLESVTVADAAPVAPDTRPRDAQGRFIPNTSQAQPQTPPRPASPTPAPAEQAEDDDSHPPTNVTQFQKRLAKERAKRGDVERRYDALLERVDRWLQQIPTSGPLQPTPPKPAPPAPASASSFTFPTYDAFQAQYPEASYEEYLDARAAARADATIETKLAAERSRLETETQTRAAEAALQQIHTLGTQTHADFEATIQGAFDAGLRWAPHVTHFVLRQTETAAEAVALTYALAKDHALLQRINTMPPGRALYELGKIAAGVSSSSAAAASSGTAAPAPSISRAPAPILPVGTGAAASSVTLESLVKEPEISLKKLRALQGR